MKAIDINKDLNRDRTTRHNIHDIKNKNDGAKFLNQNHPFEIITLEILLVLRNALNTTRYRHIGFSTRARSLL